ncbi:MAG: NrfD/PsrC family molybdoenzyme membrane anchor subunit [Xanthomonadales bacterium]|jgi:molybdopterin-containing oxidoreductase family membrane subunit|nr:NrfD/PsrC family molybdoenzyme membrane anchor subunit [Xanthomonadales bacterium]
MTLLHFILDGLRAMFSGDRRWWGWLVLLTALIAAGAAAYGLQWRDGLVVTGMSDQVSWGFYIANFAFLVGIAAAAVLLVIPAYVFHREDIKSVVLIGEGLAVAAVIGAMLFVIVDLGRPDRLLHMIPGIGRFNFPASLLAWDVVVLNGYLLLNLAIPFYVHFCHYRGRTPNLRAYFPWVVLAMFWAISIHTVTAFLFSANTARPFWNIALLGPRFIATAFVSGPALIILLLQVLKRVTRYPVPTSIIETLSLIMAVALQISLFFVAVELFTDFYNESSHAASIRYLYFGLEGLDALRPAIWTALAMNLVAVVILSVHPLRRRPALLNVACGLAFIGIWLEKGMGFVVPGFIPTPLGEVFEYAPTSIELIVALGIWSVVALVFSLLAKASIALSTSRGAG